MKTYILFLQFLSNTLLQQCAQLSLRICFLCQLFKRVLTAQNFPHEIGIFLGYPLEDVILFEKQNGKNCKYCGCWKSYSNAEEAKSCCCKYKQCSEFCLAGYKNGLPIQQVIENYKKIFVKQESAISA